MEVNIFGEGAVGYKNIVKSSSSQDFFLYKKYKTMQFVQSQMDIVWMYLNIAI